METTNLFSEAQTSAVVDPSLAPASEQSLALASPAEDLAPSPVALLDVDEEFLDDEEEEDDPTESLNAIKRRCEAAKITYKESAAEEGRWLTISLPAGRETRTVVISNSSHARQVLSSEFESIKFVGDFEAICRYESGYIVAALSFLGGGLANMRYRELFGVSSLRDIQGNLDKVINVTPPPDHPNLQVTLGLYSNELAIFTRRVGSTRPVLTISNIELTTNERAAELLETIANSLFFEMDLRLGIPIALSRYRRLTSNGTRRGHSTKSLLDKPLQFPTNSYDRRAVSLYSYGRSASGMPLLRFLAFYQSIEFYFPTYSQNEAIRQTKKVLKDPRFNIHDDADLARLVSGIQTSRSGSIGDERSQLKVVINSCVDAETLRELLESEFLRDFYTDDKHRWKQLSKVKIPIGDKGSDLRSSIAERMYDIRCRIVHAKSDGGQTDMRCCFLFQGRRINLRRIHRSFSSSQLKL